jgi:molybdopterin-guanine dinucleotide biosynthesis protein A
LDVNCIILAGGNSTRLGYDKVTATLTQERLLERVLEKVDFARRIIIVTGKGIRNIPWAAGCDNIEIIGDAIPDRGPLGGIYSGLMASDADLNVVVACDMPFLCRELIGYMLEQAPGYDAVIPRMGELVEPLHAVYASSSLKPIEDKLKAGRLGVHKLFKYLKVRYVERDEIERFDPDCRSFFNINTEADLLTARRLSREAGL